MLHAIRKNDRPFNIYHTINMRSIILQSSVVFFFFKQTIVRF